MFITNEPIIIGVNIGDKPLFTGFADFPELVEDLILKLDLVQLRRLADEVVPERLAELENKAIKAKPTVNKISANLLRRVNDAGCSCGRQKTEGLPFCGVCFTRLPPDVQDQLRRAKGTVLEETYHLAVAFLRGGRRR